MAKDKSEKSGKGKGEKSGKSKGDAPKLRDDFAKPSEAPAAGDGWNLTEEAEGRLIIFTPLREIEAETKDYGVKSVIVADVVVINEKKPEKSEPHADVYVWGGYLRGALRSSIGQARVLGRLVRGTKKEKGNLPWLLQDATDAETQLAREYLASVDPFGK